MQGNCIKSYSTKIIDRISPSRREEMWVETTPSPTTHRAVPYRDDMWIETGVFPCPHFVPTGQRDA